MDPTTHKASAPYLGFSKDHPQDDARFRFKARFGKEPAEVFVDGTALLVGPILEEDLLSRKTEIGNDNKRTLSKP